MKEKSTLLLGFLRRRECVVPTWRGWLALLGVLAIAAIVFVWHAYDFLAMNAPPHGGILVVEGWGPDFFMTDAVKEYRSNHYDGIYTTGGPVDMGSLLIKYKTYAEMAAATLEQMGVDPSAVHAIPADSVERDRTYTSAIALKKWLSSHGVEAKTITLITLGAHARRSHLLYEKAFGSSAQVGVISVCEKDINPHYWWTNSAGFRSVIDELVAYFYARFLFHAQADK